MCIKFVYFPLCPGISVRALQLSLKNQNLLDLTSVDYTKFLGVPIDSITFNAKIRKQMKAFKHKQDNRIHSN